jgi:hypothetical protein
MLESISSGTGLIRLVSVCCIFRVPLGRRIPCRVPLGSPLQDSFNLVALQSATKNRKGATKNV